MSGEKGQAVSSLSFECEQIAEQARFLAEHDACSCEVSQLASLIEATSLNLSKLCKGMGL
jgi:hypothetical protein